MTIAIHVENVTRRFGDLVAVDHISFEIGQGEIFGLSGALFPISSLPGWLVPITMLDPLTYWVEGIRYGLTGVSQINPVVSFAVIGGFTVAMTVIGAYLFRKIAV